VGQISVAFPLSIYFHANKKKKKGCYVNLYFHRELIFFVKSTFVIKSLSPVDKPFIVSPFTLSQPTSAKLVNHFIKLLFGVENLSFSLPIWT